MGIAIIDIAAICIAIIVLDIAAIVIAVTVSYIYKGNNVD